MAFQRKQGRRGPILVSLTLIFSLLAISNVAAQDDVDPPEAPGDVTVLGTHGSQIFFEGPSGYFYGDGEPDEPSPYVAIVGDPVVDVCTGSPPNTVGTTRQNDDGTWTLRIPGAILRAVYIYENDAGNPVDFLDATCPGIAEDGAEPPAPFATGWVRQSAQVTMAVPYWSYEGPQPDGAYINSITGWAFDDDGNRLRIKAKADYVLDTSVEGDPFTFNEVFLEVTPVG